MSIAHFSKEVVGRSQGTVSGLLNNPLQLIPVGTGGLPWKAMAEFLNSKSKQSDVLATQATLKGNTYIVFVKLFFISVQSGDLGMIQTLQIALTV